MFRQTDHSLENSLTVLSLVSRTIDHFTVVDLVPWPSSECEAEVDLVLIQTSLAFVMEIVLEKY